MTFFDFGKADHEHYERTRQNITETDRDMVHYWMGASNSGVQAQCYFLFIREEVQWTTQPVSCLECLARGPRP